MLILSDMRLDKHLRVYRVVSRRRILPCVLEDDLFTSRVYREEISEVVDVIVEYNPARTGCFEAEINSCSTSMKMNPCLALSCFDSSSMVIPAIL